LVALSHAKGKMDVATILAIISIVFFSHAGYHCNWL